MTATATAPRTRRKPTAPGKAKGRTPKATTGETAPVVSEEERQLAARYGHTHRIIASSWRAAGGREGYGKKRTVEVACKACDGARTRIVCTSDLQFPTTAFCLICVTDVKRNRRDKKKQEKTRK